jgi:hypothetical protein
MVLLRRQQWYWCETEPVVVCCVFVFIGKFCGKVDSAENGKEKKIDAFELWTWRRILRVPWTEKRTNLSVLEDVKSKRSLEATILRLKSPYFSIDNAHLTRALSIQKSLLLAKHVFRNNSCALGQ